MENVQLGKSGYQKGKDKLKQVGIFLVWAVGIWIVGVIVSGALANSPIDVERLDHEFQVASELLNNAGHNYCLDVASISDEKWKAYQEGKYEPRNGEDPEQWRIKRNWDCKNVKVRLDFK